MIASRIYLPEPSAASFYLSNVADVLCERGHHVRVLTVSPPPNLNIPVRKERIIPFPVLRDASGYVRGYLQYLSFDIPLFFRLLTCKKPDLVLVEPPPTSGAVVRFACSLRKIPYVYDAADLWSVAAAHATSSSLVLKMLRRVEQWALSGAEHIVTISDAVKQRVKNWKVNKPISVVGRGADTSQFSFSPVEPQNEFLYAGSFSVWHGAIVLIDAFAIFLKSHPEYRIRFIGNGTEKDAIISRAEQFGIEDRIIFSEQVTPQQLAIELSGATASLATLLPGSGYEFAFATKTYSSLASGCPVIFAGPGPTYDFFTNNKSQLPLGEGVPYNAEAIAQAMLRAANRVPDTTTRESIATWAEAHVSLRSSAERTADVIERAVGYDTH